MRVSTFFEGKIFKLGYDTSLGKILDEVTRLFDFVRYCAYYGRVVIWPAKFGHRGRVGDQGGDPRLIARRCASDEFSSR
jgi:hypothetical protein